MSQDTGAKKNDQGKLPLDLIPVRPLLDLAAVLQHGMIKYDAHNWRKGFLFSRTYAAAMRHLLLWQSGIDNDEDSGLNHLAHAMCNLTFLLEFTRTHPELDDRIKQTDYPDHVLVHPPIDTSQPGLLTNPFDGGYTLGCPNDS